jgi:hypothetical protein
MTDEETHAQGEDLVVVFRAPDEVSAQLVRGLLVGEDIPAVLQSAQVPWMDGIMKMGKGYWGDVVVPTEYADRSRAIIEAYQADSEKSEG